MSETTGERKLAELLYRAIRELEYVQELGTDLAVSSEGAAIVREGMALLGVADLSADDLPADWKLTNVEKYTCTTCHREFWATPEDVNLAKGHLCIAAEQGVSQHEALERLRHSAEYPAER